MTGNQSGATYWSLSEFLNLLELRSQCWCFVEMGVSGGFSIPHSDTVLFYAMLDGSATIADPVSGDVELVPGDIMMVLSGDAHALRSRHGNTAPVHEFLHNGEYVDVPPSFTLGEGPAAARMLCGRLKVRWPAGHHPNAIPSTLRLKPTDNIINFEVLERAAKKNGAAAALTRTALLLFILAFREHPECEKVFRDSNLHHPIARAQQFIQMHPFAEWTVVRLARKVGMGRSNFAARFLAEVGRTPMDVVTEERMKHAASFLARTDLKISEISERIGYRSEAAFNRRFSTHYGAPPGQMRKYWRQAKEEALPPPPVSLFTQEPGAGFHPLALENG